MKLLLTNDDGIDAPGLRTLEQAVQGFGEPITVAPDRHLSGCSHRVNNDRMLNAAQASENRFALDGTPADCTRVGLFHLAEDADWVLSGVNDGGNLGVDVFMSGTVAAVREAAWHHVPGIAFSQYRKSRWDFDWTKVVPLIQRILKDLMSRPMNPGEFWNVNLPDLQSEAAISNPDAVEIIDCPLNRHPLNTEFEVSGGQYQYKGVYGDRKRDPGTDVDACFSGKVAVTRIRPCLGD